MLGLFGTLSLGSRSLATQRQGVEVAGHNLANASNPAYSRQRVSIQSTAEVISPYGPVGTGADAVAITQIRSQLLDTQIVGEESVGGSLEAQQRGLQYAQARLGQQIDRLASGSEGATAANGVGGGQQLATGLADLFNAFQSLSTQPTSMSERQIVMMRAASLATQFNQLDTRMGELDTQLGETLAGDVSSANALMSDIAQLNDRISRIEGTGAGTANDLRDHRQAKLEELAKLVKFDAVEGVNGSVDIAIGGNSFVTGDSIVTKLETYDPGDGRPLIRAAGTDGPLTLTGGTLHGTIDVRDGAIRDLRNDLQSIARNLISEVNAAHAGGYALDGTTGNSFFLGTGAGDIRVNPALSGNPALLQASGDANARGDNSAVLAMAQLAGKAVPGLNGQTFAGQYSRSVAALGESLSSVNRQLSDHQVVGNMLATQRDSVSGVSVDEEMTDLTRFQRAYQASAKLINTVDELLEITLGLKR